MLIIKPGLKLFSVRFNSEASSPKKKQFSSNCRRYGITKFPEPKKIKKQTEPEATTQYHTNRTILVDIAKIQKPEKRKTISESEPSHLVIKPKIRSKTFQTGSVCMGLLFIIYLIPAVS